MSARTAIAVSAIGIAAALVAPPARAWVDPYFGPTSQASPQVVTPANRAFHDYMADFHTRLVGGERPGAQSIVDRPREDRHEVAMPRDVQFRVFQGLQLRRNGHTSHVLGAALPVDGVVGMLPNALVAMRLGVEFGRVGVYGVGGGGTLTVFQHIVPQRDAEPITVTTGNRLYGFVGAGAELELLRWMVFAAEVDFGRVHASHGNGYFLAPDPTETVRTAVGALRVNY